MSPKPLAVLALPLAALTLVSAHGRGADAVSFHPEEGLALRKSFVQKFAQRLDDLTVTVNGEEQEIPELPDIRTSSTERVVLVDRYRALGEGRPAKLAREFAELTGTKLQSQEGEETEEDLSSELEGAVVVFAWDADDEEYGLEVEDGDLDSDWLAELREDADLRGFLPEDAVEEGDTWEVDIEAFHRLLSPGGDLRIVGPDGRDEDEHELSVEIEDNMDGELEAEYRGTREVDGATLAVIAVTGATSSSADSTLENEMGTIDRTFEVEMDIEIELLWSLAGGHFVSVDLSAQVEVTILEEQDLAFGEQEMSIEQEIVLAGELEVQGTAERTE